MLGISDSLQTQIRNAIMKLPTRLSTWVAILFLAYCVWTIFQLWLPTVPWLFRIFH